jgi:hypothetical protein
MSKNIIVNTRHWLGINCEIGSNPCWNTPCRNGGTCLSLSTSYLCQCSLPYGGANCDLIINVCTPNPCLNGGMCIRSSNPLDVTYRCDCLSGYIGARCEYRTSKSLSNSCRQSSIYSLESIVVGGCNPSPCRNGGQCTTTTRNCTSIACIPDCVCPSGFTGAFCERQDASCFSVPCMNGGTCSINTRTNQSSCRCPPNTAGAR